MVTKARAADGFEPKSRVFIDRVQTVMDMKNSVARAHRPSAGAPAAAQGHSIRPVALLEALWRRKATVTLTGLLAALIAGALSLTMPRSYTSTSQILIDPRGLKVVEKDIAPQAREPDLSVSIIESEMRILGSDLVLRRVVDQLGLAQPAEDAKPRVELPVPLRTVLDGVGKLRDRLKALLGRTTNEMTNEQAALLQLQKAVRISRQPSTYVVDVAATSKDRELAARIANTVAEQYIQARFDGRAEASRKAAQAIDGRLDELRQKIRETDGAVERYKESKGLVTSSGRLLTEQRMGELSSQLQVARGETVRAQTRVDEINAARRDRGSTGASLETLQSATLERLRSSQAVARQREASLSATMLPSHPLVRQARQEIRSVERSVDQELARIAETALTALGRAQSTERALERQLADVTRDAARESAALVELRELERVAEANRSVYQSFLVRTRELAEQQRIDPNLAVMLASAEPARDAGGPGLMPIAAAAGLAGLGLGAAFALRRDFRDPRLRSELQLEAHFDRQSIHRVPVAPPRRLGLRSGAGSRPDRALYFVGPPDSPTAAAVDRLYRSLGARRPRNSARVYVVVAAEPYQGKSTVALNLAAAAARAGESVLLLDANREAPVATLDAGATEKPGLAEVLQGMATPKTAVIKRTDPPMDLLPAGKLAELPPSRASLDGLGDTLLSALDGYDVIVVDAASAGRDRLTLALAGHADACLLVAQEGSASKAALAEAGDWLDSVASGEVHVVMVSPS